MTVSALLSLVACWHMGKGNKAGMHPQDVFHGARRDGARFGIGRRENIQLVDGGLSAVVILQRAASIVSMSESWAGCYR
jgi:hypothetical protein